MKLCLARTKRRRIANIVDVSAADDLRRACKQPSPAINPAKAWEAISLISNVNLTSERLKIKNDIICSDFYVLPFSLSYYFFGKKFQVFFFKIVKSQKVLYNE